MAPEELSKEYCTGSRYVGENNVTWNGKGVYTYPDGMEYHGEFKNGQFHGNGCIITPQKFHLFGQFVKGKCIEYTKLIFPCGLEYTTTHSGKIIDNRDDSRCNKADDDDTKSWSYCNSSDRRFQIEIEHGIAPVYESYETGKPKPAIKIPKGYYDSGEGFMDPTNASIYSYTDLNQYIRTVCKEEQNWILKFCRHNMAKEYGYDEDVLRQNEDSFKSIRKSISDLDEMSGDCYYSQKLRGKKLSFAKYRSSRLQRQKFKL